MMQLFKRGLATILCAAVLICGCCMPKSPMYVQADAVGPAAFAGAALSAFVMACGINFNFTGANASTAADAVMGLWDEFSSSTGAGSLGVISEGKLSISSLGKIIIAPALVATFRSFVDWLQGDKGLTAGGSFTVSSGLLSLPFADGSKLFSIGSYDDSTKTLVLGSVIPALSTVHLSNGYSLSASYESFTIKNPDGSLLYSNAFSQHAANYMIVIRNGVGWAVARDLRSNPGVYSVVSSTYLFSESSSVWLSGFSDSGSLSLSAPDAIDVPGEGIADDQAVVVDVGAAAGITADELTDAINAALAAGTATATATVETVAAGEVVPVPEVEGLGLPSLGAALTSRFPFSIPWDVAAIVGLLSAEPQAPYWSVDLMQPLRARGVHFNGSTTIEVDLRGEQWAVIGQVCRWGTLITFCLGLAFATKRLIWSA